MTEKPIHFPAAHADEMIRAILAGRKTQHRVPVKFPAGIIPRGACDVRWLEGKSQPEVYACGGVWFDLRSPWSPGTRLWVRECWDTVYCTAEDDGIEGDIPFYRADYEDDPTEVRWRPSIHMPRWASRITLEVVEVRVQRVQDISHNDGIAEGCLGSDWTASSPYIADPHTDSGVLPVEDFQELWDRIYAGKGLGWDENPWIFAATLKRLSP